MSMFDVGWVVVVRERNATFDHMWLQVGKLVIAERNSGARVHGKHENYNTSSVHAGSRTHSYPQSLLLCDGLILLCRNSTNACLWPPLRSQCEN